MNRNNKFLISIFILLLSSLITPTGFSSESTPKTCSSHDLQCSQDDPNLNKVKPFASPGEMEGSPEGTPTPEFATEASNRALAICDSSLEKCNKNTHQGRRIPGEKEIPGKKGIPGEMGGSAGQNTQQ